MTTLVLGTVGAYVGGAFGGPIGSMIGYMAGSLLGSLLDPPKIQGPRLGDTKLQRSTYGATYPYIWGQGRLGVIIIDQTDLEEHTEKTSGKGGPVTTNYTYSASWLAAICIRMPNYTGAIAGITEIYMDGRLVWSEETGEDLPCTVYLGTETQLPDPTFEAIHGVGFQPAYRGIAYLAFTDTFLTDYGNRIPNIEVVAYTKTSDDFPVRIASFHPWDHPSHLVAGVGYENRVITTTSQDGLGAVYTESHWKVDGTEIGSTTEYIGSGGSPIYYVRNLAGTYVAGYGSNPVHWTIPDPNAPGQLKQGADSTNNASIQGNGNIYMEAGDFGGAYIFGVSANSTPLSVVGGHRADGKVPQDVADHVQYVLDLNYSLSTIHLGTSDDEHVYVSVGIPGACKLWKLDIELNLVHFWDVPATSGTRLGPPSNFAVYNNQIVFKWESGGLSYVAVVRINDDLTLEDVGTPLLSLNTISANFVVQLHGCIMMDEVGTFSVCPAVGIVLLAEVVDDLASMTPATTYDNVEGIDRVRWFIIASQMTVRNALDKLRPVFFFDIVEEDYSLNLIKRGDRPVITIADDDLLARPYGEEPGDPLRTLRKREQELPRTVTLTYVDVNADYNVGAQGSPRQVTQSQYDVTIEIPVGFEAAEAAQKSWTIQCAEWNERESFEWQLLREYSYITPGTLCNVRGRTIRVQSCTESPLTGVIEFVGVLAAPSLYTQTATGQTTQGAGTGGGGDGSGGNTGGPGSTAPFTISTKVVLLDIPILSQADYPNGFYAILARSYYTGTWTGASLYQSKDSGTTWNLVASTNATGIIGNLLNSDVVGSSPTVYAAGLAVYTGGDVVDETTVMVRFDLISPAISSITSTGLTNGLNLCAISYGAASSPVGDQVTGWELAQFRDAVQVDDNHWLLTGWLRGRYNTTPGGHASGEAFVILPGIDVDMVAADLNKTFQYKAVTFGQSLDLAASFDFTNTGISSDTWHEGVLDGLGEFIGACGSPTNPRKGLVPAPTELMCGGDYFLNADGDWQQVASGSALVVLSPAYAATVTVDLTAYSTYSVVVVNVGTLTGNITFNITNGADGQIIRARFKQDGTGGRTFAAGANLRFSTDTPSPILSTGINKTDRLGFEWHGANGTADLVAINKGYS